MIDNDMLLAMSELMDKKLEPLKNAVQRLEDRVQRLEDRVQRLEDRVQGLESEVQEIKIRVKKIEITQENEVLPRLRNIEECYISTYDRYKEGVSEHEALKQDVSMLKQVVAEHSEKLQKIS